MIHVERVYQPVKYDAGKRFLVDRLWPAVLKRTPSIMMLG
jgi:uncharacterized protein YeaO (DUF488 family)